MLRKDFFPSTLAKSKIFPDSETLAATGGACCCPQTPETRKVSGIGLHHPGVHTPSRVGSKSCFCDFLTPCMHQLKIPKIWRRAIIVAIHKPEKPLGDPKTYRPMSLLCVPFKMLERLIYARVETITDSQLPQEQAVFQHGRSAVDQVTLLMQDIEDSF